MPFLLKWKSLLASLPVLFLMVRACPAQSEYYELYGRVIDHGTRKGIPYASVGILEANRAYADSLGYFRIKSGRGPFTTVTTSVYCYMCCDSGDNQINSLPPLGIQSGLTGFSLADPTRGSDVKDKDVVSDDRDPNPCLKPMIVWTRVVGPLATGKPEQIKRPVNYDSFSGTYRVPGTGGVFGRVIDRETKEPVAWASIALFMNGQMIAGDVTDLSGYFTLSNIRPGSSYEISVSGRGIILKDVTVMPDTVSAFEIETITLSLTSKYNEAKSASFFIPYDSFQVIQSLVYYKMNRKPLPSLHCVKDNDGKAGNIKGDRSGSGGYVYIDGVKVYTKGSSPNARKKDLQPIITGTSAQYANPEDQKAENPVKEN